MSKRIFESLCDMQFHLFHGASHDPKQILAFMYMKQHIIDLESTKTPSNLDNYRLKKTAEFYIKYIEQQGYQPIQSPNFFDYDPGPESILYRLHEIVQTTESAFCLFEQKYDLYSDLRHLLKMNTIDKNVFYSHLGFLDD